MFHQDELYNDHMILYEATGKTKHVMRNHFLLLGFIIVMSTKRLQMMCTLCWELTSYMQLMTVLFFIMRQIRVENVQQQNRTEGRKLCE